MDYFYVGDNAETGVFGEHGVGTACRMLSTFFVSRK